MVKPMRKRVGSRNTILAGIALATSLVALANRAAAQETFNWTGRITTGKTLEIKGINGNVRAVAASSDNARVTARKSARRSDPEDVRIEVVEHAGGVTICAVYPAPPNRQPNQCRPGSGGRSDSRNNDVNVEFAVEVPRGVRFTGRTVNGGVTATSLASDVRAHTVNGSVNVSTSALAQASTVNGSLTVSMGRTDWTGDLEFETVNGNIRLTLAGDVSTDVTASTVTGSIASDYPLLVRGRFGPKRLSGRIGQGGRTLLLGTVNGNIDLRRR